MRHLEYRNKRNNNGHLLKNTAYSLSYDFTNHCIDIISKYEIYGKLSSYFDEKYIEFHFRKTIFYEFLPIAHQLTIKQWDDENSDNSGIVSIDASSFNCSELLKTIEIIKNDNLIFDFNGSLTLFQRAKKKYRPLIKIIKNILIYLNRISPFAYSNNENVTSLDSANSSRVAVYLTDGIDLNNRSNLFWLADSNIDSSSLLIYFSLNNKQSKSVIRKLKEKKLQWVNLKAWSAPKKLHLGKNILDFIKNKKPDNKIHKWILMESYNLIREINYWYSFFQYFDIKIHSDNTEQAIDTFAKQIALDRLNGVSFVAQRSYPESEKGKFYCYYPTDIFFSWGSDAAQKINGMILDHSNPSIDSILVSGCQWVNKISKNRSVYLEKIKQKLSTNGAKTIIMFLDSNHDLNASWQDQFIETKILEKIYISLLKMVIDNEEIALIIKPKKIKIFESLYNNIGSYLNEADKKGRLYITEVVGEKPSDYASISDLVVGITSEGLPAAVIECAILKKPAIIYDYSDLSGVEKHLYSWGYQKVIFDNIESMMSEIKLFSKNENKYNDFGEWGDYLVDFDSFQDYMSHLRIGFYLQLLLKFLNSGIEKKVVLKMANEAYSKKYGKEFITTNSFKK